MGLQGWGYNQQLFNLTDGFSESVTNLMILEEGDI